jgi:hypothetical protein
MTQSAIPISFIGIQATVDGGEAGSAGEACGGWRKTTDFGGPLSLKWSARQGDRGGSGGRQFSVNEGRDSASTMLAEIPRRNAKKEGAPGSLPLLDFGRDYCSATRPDCEQGDAGKPNAAACELTRTTPVSSIQYAAVPDVS